MQKQIESLLEDYLTRSSCFVDGRKHLEGSNTVRLEGELDLVQLSHFLWDGLK